MHSAAGPGIFNPRAGLPKDGGVSAHTHERTDATEKVLAILIS